MTWSSSGKSERTEKEAENGVSSLKFWEHKAKPLNPCTILCEKTFSYKDKIYFLKKCFYFHQTFTVGNVKKRFPMQKDDNSNK